MTTAELQRIASDILPPVGASVAIAMVDHEPGSLLSNGYPSGIGGRTTFRAGFLVNGRQRVPIGPSFDRARDVYRLVRLLNGVSTTPVVEQRRCQNCGGPLPDGSRADRQTCGDTCRQSLARADRPGSPETGAGPAALPTSARRRPLRRPSANRDKNGLPGAPRSAPVIPTVLPPSGATEETAESDQALTRSAQPNAAPGEAGQRAGDLTLGLTSSG